MWYFNSPLVVFGDDALAHLESLTGRLAFIVTDHNMKRMGFPQAVEARLCQAGIRSVLFAEVEPDPCLQTVRRCAAAMLAAEPDWIIGLGGGSCLDVAKAAWLLYERPDVDPASINPFEHYGVRAKARLAAIPTTSGTGSEATWAVVLTDPEASRKLALGARELLPDLAIVDPSLAATQPPAQTADTGLDALTHAIEGYTGTWRNDFSDGLCLKAIELIFEHLPAAVADGSNLPARTRLHNAATIAGMGFGNSMTGLAHAMGHALGARFRVPHGRCVGLCLPATIQFIANGGGGRYQDIARLLRLPADDDRVGAASLVAALRALQRTVAQPATAAELLVTREAYAQALPHLVELAEGDSDLVTSPRLPTQAELHDLFERVYDGRDVEF